MIWRPTSPASPSSPARDCGGHDLGPRGLRYLEWTWDPDPADDTYEVDYAFLLREADGATWVEHDRHVEGLFARQQWLTWLTDAGFDPEVVLFDHSELEPGSYEIFVCRKPE